MSFFKKILTPPTEQESRDRDFRTLADDGIRAMQMGELPYARTCLEKALEMQPDDLRVLSCCAEVYFRLSLFKEALPAFTRLADAEPDNANILLLLARTQGELGRHTDMHDTLDRIPPCPQTDAIVQYFMAEADFHLDKPLEAIAEVTKALTDRPDFAAASLLRARILVAMGQYTEALKDSAPLLDTDEPSEDVLVCHARAQAGSGDSEGATTTLQRLRELNPFHHEAVILLGNLYAEQSRWDAALALYDEVIELQPDFAEAYKLRGAVKYHLHDEAGAADDLKRSLELAPEAAQDLTGEYSNVENRVNATYKRMNPYGF